ncbi:hypothetical protein MMPV_005718 [Pyropia vietnamensis]
MTSARTRIGERWRLLRLRRGDGAARPSSLDDSTGKARRRVWVEAILPAAALGTLLFLGGGVVLRSGGSGSGGVDGDGGRYLRHPPMSLGIGALVGEADAVEGWALPWEATPTVCRLHGACLTREGGLVLPAWVGRGQRGGQARRLLRACGLTGRRAPAFADPLPLPPPLSATTAPASDAAHAVGPAAGTGATTYGETGGAAAATVTTVATTTGRYLPADLVLLDTHGAARTAGTASRLYRLLRGQAYTRAVAGGDGLGGATAGGGRVSSGWWWGWWAALRRHRRYACVGLARTTCALLPWRPLRPVVASNTLAEAGGGGVGALAAAVGAPWAVPAPAEGPGAPAVLATAAVPSADGLVCYRSVVAGTTDLARVPVGGLAWQRPLPPPQAASAEGSAAGLSSVARLSRSRVGTPCRLRVVIVVPVVAPGRRPHHLENLYALQDALQAAATPAALTSPAGVPALPVASLPLTAVTSAAAAAARPLELAITTHHPGALNDSAAALAAADIAILPHDPAYAAAVGLLPPGAMVVELYPFAAAPPFPRRRRGARRGGHAAAPGGAVSRRASLAAAAAAADGSTEPLAAALGVAVTPVGGLPDGDTFATCLGSSPAAATSRRATAKLLRRWRRAARRAGRGGAGGGGAAGAGALPPVRGGAGGHRGGGRSPLRRAADACVAAQATIVDVPRVVAVIADHVRGRCVR